jgi:hypothetical protein
MPDVITTTLQRRKPDGSTFPAIVQNGVADARQTHQVFGCSACTVQRATKALVLGFSSKQVIPAEIFTRGERCSISEKTDSKVSHCNFRRTRSLLHDEAYITPPTLNSSQSLLSKWIIVKCLRD